MSARKMGALGVVFVGVALEHIDMMLVNLFATTLAAEFILTSNDQDKMVMGFLGYGISFLFRPLGAGIFGLIGDTFGRKPSMLLSIFFMSAATLAIGWVPSFMQIGVFATILFVLCRIVQGLSVGGEYGAAMTYAYEISKDRKTLAGALVISSTHVGGLAAALLAAYFHRQFQIPFRVAGTIGLLSLALRSFLIESHPAVSKSASVKKVLQKSFSHPGAYRKSFVIASALVFTFYASLVYLNEIIFQRGLAERSAIFRTNAAILVVWIIMPPLLGYSVDKFGIAYKRVMATGAALVACFVTPLLYAAAASNSFAGWVGVQFALSLFHSAYCFATPRYLGDQFGESSRNTGVALGYSLGASFTAALTPLICHGIVSYTGRVEMISAPIVMVSALAAWQLFRERN